MIEVHRFLPDRLRRHVVHLGQAKFLADWAVERTDCFAGFIEFDHDIDVLCPIPHTETQFVLNGRAEYRFTTHPGHAEERVVTVAAGDMLVIAFGTMIRWRILERPFRIGFAVMPAPPQAPGGSSESDSPRGDDVRLT